MHVLAAAAEPWYSRNAELLALIFGISSLVGIVLTVYFYLRQRQSKTLDWELGLVERLITTAEAGEPGLSYRRTALETPFLLRFRFVNTGDKAITTGDFAKPITIALPGATIHYARVTATEDGMAKVPAANIADLDSANDNGRESM